MCNFLLTLFLCFKWVTTVRNLVIDSHHYKRHRENIPTAFHSLSRFTLTTTQLNPLSLKTLNYSKMNQRLVLSFRNLHSFHSNVTKKAIIWSEVHSKLMTKLALLLALVQDAKLVLSFTTPQMWWLGMIHIMLYALYASLDHAHQDLLYLSILLLWYDLWSCKNFQYVFPSVVLVH